MFQIDYATDLANVVIEISDAHIGDPSTVAAMDSIETSYESKGKKATFGGMNDVRLAFHEPHSAGMAGIH